MQRLLLAVVLIVCGATHSVARGELAVLADGESADQTGLIVRAQSPSTTIAPPPLRVAQDYTLQPTPYYPTTTVAPPVAVAQYDPYGNPVSSSVCPWADQCAGVFGEFLYWHVRNDSVSYAVPQNSLLLPGSAPIGPAGATNFNFNFGYRAGGFIGLGSESRLVGTYTHFNNSTNSEVDAAAPAVINPLVLFPGTFTPAFAAHTATASQSVNLQMIDVDYEAAAECCKQYWWGYIAGARYAQLDQAFSAAFAFAPPPGATNLNSAVNFNGIGPTAGLQGERIVFPSAGLRVYGKSTASFLVGQFQSSYVQTNAAAGTQVNTALTSDRIVPVLDLEVGLAWVSPEQRVRISGGYMIAAWFNSVTEAAWIQSVQRADFSPGSNTLTFDGVTARAEVRF